MKPATKFSNTDVDRMCAVLIRQITLDNWRPSYIVGINPTGLIPATMLAMYFNLRLETLTIDLEHGNTESNCWMAEDAAGHGLNNPKNILIVDSVNENGKTFEWIKDDFSKSVRNETFFWDKIWNESTRFAVLVDNLANYTMVNYSAVELNYLDSPITIEFPWQKWW